MKHSVPLYSPHEIDKTVSVLSSVQRVLNRHSYILGEEVALFEKEFSQYCNVEVCVGVANGTDALEVALRAVGVQQGDKVATTSNCGGYASIAIRLIGAHPVYVDVEQKTLTMDVGCLEKTLKTHTLKACVVTHLYGQTADIHSLFKLAQKYSIPMVEDCAQAHGADIGGQKAGSIGDVGCFSFYPTKNLGGVGDGGAVVSNSLAYRDRLKALRQYGWSTKYHMDIPFRRNSRLDEIQAAVLRDRLPYLDTWNQQRRVVAQTYHKVFSDTPVQGPLSRYGDYVGHLYVVRVPQRDSVRAMLRQNNIATDVHYPVLDHHQKAFYDKNASLPVSEEAVKNILTLPCYPGLSENTVLYIAECVKAHIAEMKDIAC